jgi:hypothetical protein
VLGVLIAIGAAVAVGLPIELDALQRMAGYAGKGSAFKDAQEYLESLRDSLIPLAIPLGAIGLTAGGVAFTFGNPMAQKILGGVVIGLALALMGPSLVA